jgi:hypothetical protein|tara:strand:+ start:651 stop:890 length:240 start_codon:yes stop_codon:yes gene_type:complete
MHLELKKSFEANKLFFGVRETLRNSAKLNKVLVPSDCRTETINLLNENKIDFESVEKTGEEIMNQFELDFMCEVFGLKK